MDQNVKPANQDEELSQEVRDLMLTLPKDTTLGVSLYQNFWFRTIFIPRILSLQTHFEARDQDIIVASQPKSGTTWLKALVFSIVNRTRFSLSESPLLKSNPHVLVPFLEIDTSSGKDVSHLKDIPSPRLFGTHMPYVSLPESIKGNSNCRLVYICRNPLDTIVSFWHFASKFNNPERRLSLSVDEYAESFGKGVSYYGPFWDHVLSYWEESLKNPNKVLFLKYEDLKTETLIHVKRLAEFLGYPFSHEEEVNGVIEQIIHICSFNNLKNLEVNKVGTGGKSNIEVNTLFRKGEVGDSKNYLSSSQAEGITSIIHEKFRGSGLNIMMP